MSDAMSEGRFSTDTEGLDAACSPEIIRLHDGDSHQITIKPVRKRLGDAEVRMLGYNGSIPGPTLHIDQGSEVTIEATNLGDVDTTLALAWPSPREPLRRCARRDAGPDPARRDVHLPPALPGSRPYDLGRFTVSGEVSGEAGAKFDELRFDPKLGAEREHIEAELAREPDTVLAFHSQMPLLYGDAAEQAFSSSYVCPMHPEVTASETAT